MIVSNHAIEEYINDNVHIQDDVTIEKRLVGLLNDMLRLWAKKFTKDWRTIIRRKDEAIVYWNGVIITYYRIINKGISRKKEKFKNRILTLLNNPVALNMVKSRESKEIRTAREKAHRKILRENLKPRWNDVFRKCFKR